ncbi:MAG: T9SS type A sorting domain-containing protein [Bacteroidota bacterium]|nr:T9SS type A sorting domain-containing protein [Bacteroidota bacterium]
MENNKLLDIGHNGDPHMLWLFEGGNTDSDPPVWDYDPALIEDTAYAHVGLSSYDIDSLDLYPAVAFNGACHSGEPKHVMVEGDIAATFGDTDGYVEFYDMSDDFSFALSILKTGITGYFAPCGSNNANDQSEDVYNAFLYDEPLGDIHKRSNDGVVMEFLGNRPALKLFESAESTWGCDVLTYGDFDPNNWSGACYMLGGKANRIYFGDPMFDPFTNNHDEALEITTSQIDSVDDNSLEITIQYNKPENPPYFPVWDKFHYSDTRIYLPVELPEYCDSITDIQVMDSSGAYHDVFYAIEHFDGKTIFHLEIDIPNDMYSEIQYNMTLQLSYLSSAGTNDITAPQPFSIYPNPADGMVYVNIQTGKFEKLRVTDITGKVVYTLPDTKTRQHQLDLQDLPPGTYFVNLKVVSEIYTKKLILQ